jgi:hypothetical protein
MGPETQPRHDQKCGGDGESRAPNACMQPVELHEACFALAKAF